MCSSTKWNSTKIQTVVARRDRVCYLLYIEGTEARTEPYASPMSVIARTVTS